MGRFDLLKRPVYASDCVVAQSVDWLLPAGLRTAGACLIPLRENPVSGETEFLWGRSLN